ncbi:MAG: hypothetical protein NTY30_02775 [Candidatus Berkelbacteria bacterium]|nr:hypothetical protein [Candidatus Berkelbacteria bacterium]
MPDLPHPDDSMISDADKSTPEQREAEKAERLAEFRQLTDPIMDKYWQEGDTPFGIPRDEVMAKISARRFEAVEAAEIQYDAAFFGDVQAIVVRINEVSGQNNYLGTYPVWALENQIAIARGEEPKIDPAEVGYITSQIEKYFKQAVGVTLQEWATEYAKTHKDFVYNPETDKTFFDTLEKDYNTHILNLGNLIRVLSEYARGQGIQEVNIEAAMQVLSDQGFVVPAQWSEEYAELSEGQDILNAIQKLPERLLQLEVADEITGNLEALSPEDLAVTVIDSTAVLKVISENYPVPDNWNACDRKTKDLVIGVIEGISERLGGKVTKKKGEPKLNFS